MEIIRLNGGSPAEIFEAMSTLDKECIGSEGWSAKAFLEEACQPGGIVLAAFCEGSFAGLFAGFTASGTGEVLTIATAPEYRRHGVARALMTEFLRLVPEDTETVALEVRQSNSAAIALYESFGFERAGIRKRFYSCPEEDAAVMVCKLSKE
jgi:ribosomal-protein-alanine acetyltransferase